MFLSIFAATCRPNNIVPFFDNLAATCDDPTSFEVLIKLDEGADDLIRIIEEYKLTSNLNIKYLATSKLDGYYSLEVGYNELLKIAHPDTYFCWLLTDEIRFETKGWDSILQKYIGFFPDDIFRIKLSTFALKNYYDFFECLPCPDNYAVTTRKWLEISGGWGNFWGPDSWHQCVDYYLGLSKNDTNPYGVWRSYPIMEIKVGGQEAGQGIEDSKKLRERIRNIWNGWKKHSSHAAQENFNRLAQRLNAHIHAHSMKMDKYVIVENLQDKTVSLYDNDKNTCYSTNSFHLPRMRLQIMIGRRKLRLVHVFSFLVYYRQGIIERYNAIMAFKNAVVDGAYNSTVFIANLIDSTIYTLFSLLVAVISMLLLLPAGLLKSVYHLMICKIFKLPTNVTKSIKDVLELPNTAFMLAYRVFCTATRVTKIFLRTLVSIKEWKKLLKIAVGRNQTTYSLFTYSYDGKNLTCIEEV